MNRQLTPKLQIAVWILICGLLPGYSWANGRVLLQDDFSGDTLDPERWTRITAIGHSTGFHADPRGNSVTLADGVLRITQSTTDFGGAVQSADLAAALRGIIRIERRTRVHYGNNYATLMEGLMGPDGGYLLVWGYFNYSYTNAAYGAGQRDPALSLTSLPWDQWFDEVITYDPETGLGTMAINGGEPIALIGTPYTADSLHLKIGSYGWWTGHSKELDYITVTQQFAAPTPIELLGDAVVDRYNGNWFQLADYAWSPGAGNWVYLHGAQRWLYIAETQTAE
jgi:hypothetical protein